MYTDYFGFAEKPFSIVPSARYLFLSARHREAMAHLQAGLGDGGGFAMLTGEVGTGKTTVSKAMLAALDDNVRAGLILNPTFSETDLLEAVCDEFGVGYPPQATLKQLTQAIHQYLLDNHSQGVQTLLLIDEAQHLSAQVLEQLRLLTNLETDTQKLLKVLLVGQPELQQKLQTTELRQLAQRITGRYHLLPLSRDEVAEYIGFRLRTSGCEQPLFTTRAIKVIARQALGVPRLINLVCDKALQYTCYAGESRVSPALAEKACQDVLSFQAPAAGIGQPVKKTTRWPVMTALASAIILAGGYYAFRQQQSTVAASVSVPLVPQAETQNMERDSEPDSGQTADRQPDRSEQTGHQNQSIAALPARQEKPGNAQAVDPTLIQFLYQSDSETDAMLTLYQLWGVRASVLDAECSGEDTFPYRCDKRTGELTEVAELNRPVVLTITEQGAAAYPVLYAIGAEQAELINRKTRIRVARSWLENSWSGEYRLLWRSGIHSVLKPGDTGSEVAELDVNLAQALGSPPLQIRRFNMALKQRVEAFQRWQGLSVDGVVGRQTLRKLYRITDRDAPPLQPVEAATAEKTLLGYPSPGPLVALSTLKTEKQAAPVSAEPIPVQEPTNMTEASQSDPEQDQDWQLDQLDLSELSPELAQKVESALQSDYTGQTEELPTAAEPETVKLEERLSELRGRLPAMNLQMHMYSSSADGRWVKINDQELHEGDWLDGVQLLRIFPREIVVRFDGMQIEIPALYEWQG